MNPKLKIVLYGVGVFAVYIILVVILRLISGKYPENPEIFGIFATNDIWLGLIVAIVLTFSHVQRRKLK
ncbi:hypothetical protein D0T49_02225 [Paludibacter sp. 221]|uniref:hypothetical protein n=1 Tax=Paludibacter sp. 221 TaxID=2302939 RepID=UPI0013D847F4|nr:hypothetical protein [Paludibacter sp. 221]NDV45867.1 hypothetical protein [Paludibacter sp. 221]